MSPDQPARPEVRDPEVRYAVAGAVATVTIDRPARRNAMTWDVVRGLRAAVARARDDDAVRVVVLTGAGDQAFCAGADLSTMQGATDAVTDHESRGELAGLFLDLWSLGKPTVARVRGFALAGGMGLALACDLVVAADDAVFGAPEVDVGLWPFMAGVPLVRSMPPKKALELMLTGRRVDAAEAERIGFVNRVVAPADLDSAVAELTSALAAKPPGAVRLGRDAFYATWDMGAREALAVLHPLLSVVAAGDEAAEGIAARTERRPPSWQT